MIYILPDIPPSNNRFIGRTNFREYQRVKKQWAELVFYACRPRPEKPISRATVTIRYYFADNKRRDPDNYSGKMILDGLTKAGIISDDSFKNIDLHLQAQFGCHPPRTQITIAEKGDADEMSTEKGAIRGLLKGDADEKRYYK